MLRPMALRMSRLVAEWWRVGFCQGNFQSETWKCLASIESNIFIFLMFFCVAFWCFDGIILRQVANRLSSDVFRSEISMFVIDATMWHYIIDLDTQNHVTASIDCKKTLATCSGELHLENMEPENLPEMNRNSFSKASILGISFFGLPMFIFGVYKFVAGGRKASHLASP